MNIADLHLKYITNSVGEKTEVILPIHEFEALLEELEDLAIVIQRQHEPTTEHQVFLAELKADGLLSN